MRTVNVIAEHEEHTPSVAEDVPFVSPSSDLLTVIGRDGCFKLVAPLFPSAFGYTEEELLDQPFLMFIHPADVAGTSAALEKLARGEPTLGVENRFRCRDASYRRLAWTAIPTPECLLYAVARDITERSQPDEKLAHSVAREQAGALANKEGFLASVCHDVQQPLTVNLAQTQLLQRQLARRDSGAGATRKRSYEYLRRGLTDAGHDTRSGRYVSAGRRSSSRPSLG